MDYMQYQTPSPLSLQTPEQKQMGMFLHLSQLLGFLFPFAGIIAPVIIWQTQKDKTPALDAHGKMIVNFFLSCLIYGIVSAVLVIVLVGIVGLLALVVVSVVFPLVGAVKANKGELWEYPLTIKFLK